MKKELEFAKTVEITEDIYKIRGQKPSCHTYLIKSKTKNVLIDTGTNAAFANIEKSLNWLGLSLADVHLIINTHEHFDHIGANRYFGKTAIIAAHRLAAVKIERQDEYVTMYNRCGICKDKGNCDLQSSGKNKKMIVPQLWLENGTFFNLGNFHLLIIYTPGHTSGCICVYEPERKILFSGDTIFANGILSVIAPSGSAGDYINSLHLLDILKIELILPGHGRFSEQPENDIATALDNAKVKLKEARTLGGNDTWTESTPLEEFL